MSLSVETCPSSLQTPADWEANQALESRGEPLVELAKWIQLLLFLAGGGQEEAG
ncbi:MAG: hypothetical protein H0T73_09905 [Ardenticatenales bacterium]|nr:hypothetical protein [Ardenticatenales bacterium]